MDEDTRNQGPDRKDRINKEGTSKRDDAREFEISGSVLDRGEDPSPDDRDRGETSRKD